MEDALYNIPIGILKKGKPYVIACSEKLEKLLKVTKCTKESQQEVLRTTRTRIAFEYSR
jgi:hypothetical protein